MPRTLEELAQEIADREKYGWDRLVANSDAGEYSARWESPKEVERLTAGFERYRSKWADARTEAEALRARVRALETMLANVLSLDPDTRARAVKAARVLLNKEVEEVDNGL